jgi:lysophospholipase L1-like esterase
MESNQLSDSEMNRRSGESVKRSIVTRMLKSLKLIINSVIGGCALCASCCSAVADGAKTKTEDKMAGNCLLKNTFTKCVEQKKLRIGVIGNSVTYGAAFDGNRIDSYYVRLADWFRKRFPDAKIEVHTGIIFAMGPETQLFRMEDKLLAFNPDLVVAEFGAANGAWGAKGRSVTDPATEGYVRRLRMLSPDADLLINLGLVKPMMDDYRAGRIPGTVDFIRRLADNYGFVITDSGEAISKRVLAGEKWEHFMKDGIHPLECGYDVHGRIIAEELEQQWALYQSLPQDARKVTAHSFPRRTVDPSPWLWPRLAPAWFAEKLNGFKLSENGTVKFIEGAPGATGMFSPGKGRIVGILHYAGAAAKENHAELEVRLDGAGEWVRLPLNEPTFTEEERAHFYKRQFFGGYGLPAAGCRSLEFRVTDSPSRVAGRIAGFFVIEREPEVDFERK